MNKTEQALRKRIGSDYLIGCFKQRIDGSTCFTDIRGGEGNIPNTPPYLEEGTEIEYSGEPLEVGVFYSFNWQLSNNQKIVINGQVTKVDNAQFLAVLLNARLQLSGSNLELFNNFQKTIFNEVTGAQHTYIYELLQNANDYPYNGEHVQVKFILTDHYLFFMHSGACFNLRNIVGISSINQGEKRKNTETIGYKGIGFKTVFVNNEYVYLKSGDWSLRFDRKVSEENFWGECPWALMPIPTAPNELDSEIREIIEKNPMRVQFALRHKSDARKNIEQLDKVFSDNQILLFIPNVYKAEVIIDNKKKYTVEKDDTKWAVNDYRFAVPPDLKDWVKENINSGDKIPEKFKDINNVRISFAVEKEGRKLVPVENARVYNYLPTELRLGFNFLINADFVPNGSRSGLHDVNWNDRIMEQCGSLFVDWWVSFLQEENKYDMNSVFDILPQFDSRDKYAQLFLSGFSKRIVEIPCIPTLHDGKYHLVKLEDVLFDIIGFITYENLRLTDEELYEFSDTNGSLPHPDIRSNQNLIRLLTHFNCSILFNEDNLSQLCTEEDFQEWLTQDDHDYMFIAFLLESGYIMNFWSYKIFLTEDGKIDKADKIYYDIDEYVNDISFLSDDLPRLNVALRKHLSANQKTWENEKNRFKSFEEHAFTRKIFDNFAKYKELFSVKENSIHFIHFLSVKESLLSTPSDYPFFTEDGSILTDVQDLYQKNEIGKELSSHSWIENDWIQFLHEDYFTQNEEKVSRYLSSKCDIKALTTSDCYRLFIANNSRVSVIASKIKEKSASIDFYHYLLQIQDAVINLTSAMRQNYCILTTDGNTEFWTPITKTIFWQDEEWAQMAQNVWMPEGCCLAVNDCYFGGLSKEKEGELKTLLSTRQIVQKFSISGMYQSLHTHLRDVFAKITTKEISKDFLNFLFRHQAEIFKNGQIDNALKDIPILCKDQEKLSSIESYGGKIYLPSPDALELYNQPWFNHETMALCDECYTDLIDGTERCRFFDSLGLRTFDKIHYLRAHLLIRLDKIKDNLLRRDHNIAFHRYIADIHDELSDKDLENVKEMPIYISSPNDDNGVIAESSDNHYLPSGLLTDIVSKDLVPITILDAIHPDYIVNVKDKKYFVEKLNNVEIDEAGFYNYIVKDAIVSSVIPYLKNSERNIRFWRWVCDSKESKENKARLKNLPMLFRYGENDTYGYEVPNKLYISDLYSGIEGLEGFINEYVENPKFVSPGYNEEGRERDWLTLFKTLRVNVDQKNIVFKHLLPNLEKYKDRKIVGLLAKYADTIKQRLSDHDENTINCLNNLYLECNDGEFRNIKKVIVSGKYYGIDINPFPDIEIDNLVSEIYITNTADDTQRRDIIKLIVSIADHYEVRSENATELRKQKLEYFSEHQDYYAQSEAHYRIIGDLAKAYYLDSLGISKIIEGLGSIKLFTTTGKFMDSSRLYLSTIYKPDCQYMANGITTLNFVSEKYDEYCSDDIREMLISQFGVCNGFKIDNLTLLKNGRFAFYFWKDYAQDREQELADIITEDNLKDIACIPTLTGMRKPMDVYDYRISQLKKIVCKLPDGRDKFPTVELPNWVNRIGLRCKLYILDCLEYLKLDDQDSRRDVIKWFAETKDEILQHHKNAIEDYRKTANWYNGAKKWVPLNTLVALEWGNNTLKDNFGGSAYVCNLFNMPESKEVFVKLCKILNIKILSNNDFSKQKFGKCQKDNEAIKKIKKGLLYLAYKTEREDWQKIYADYNEKLEKADISKCEKIIYSYNEHISTDLDIYAEEATALWYVDSWKGSMFLEILDWIIKKIEVKGEFEKSFLRKLFLRPFVDFIKEQEGGSLPSTLLAYLDETERSEIDVDENANAEVFTEDTNIISSLPEDVKQQADRRMEQMQNQYSEDSDEFEEDDSACSGFENKNYEQPTAGRPPRSDFGGTHQRQEQTMRSRQSDEHHLSKLYNEDSENENSQTGKREPFTERLQRKWDKQKNSTVQKPHSPKKASNDFDFSNHEPTPSESNAEFFDENINTSQYTQKENRTSDNELNIGRRNLDNFNNRQKAAKEELSKAEDQVTLNDAINNTQKYTYLWFKYVMEKLFNQKDNTETTRSVQIDFKEAEILNSHQIAILKPNRVIPKWIEHADDITLHILKGTNSEKFEIDLQYFTDDAIWAYYENAYELTAKINEADKIRLVANGSYSNHIDSLTKQFLKLDFPDNYSLLDNLPDCIKYIYGPPGTGKTTRLVGKIQEILEKGNSEFDILVLTPTNKAADVIASRLSHNDICSEYTYRFGITESLDFLESNIVFTRDDAFIENNGHHIVVTTAARYPYDYLMPNEEIICDHHWDYVIIDEASMMDVVTMAFILYKSQDCQFIISGDPKQIQPIRQNEFQPENIYQMVGLNSFANAQNDPKVECLNTQYRSIPAIGDLVSKFSYNDIVKSDRSQDSQKALDLGFKISSINYIGFKTELFDNLYGLDAIDESAFHLYSVIFGYEFARYMARCIKDNQPEEPYSIGIVCPYKKQADSIMQMIEQKDISNDACTVHCGTVHSFQGDECDIMIVILNPPMNVGPNSHVNNQNVVNVAMSRAKDYVFFLVPDSRMQGFPTREVLGKISGNKKTVQFCNKIEEIMFGQEDYILQHTDVRCHMPVNVYCEPSTLYEVRKGDSAVDIQINEQFR